MKLFFEGGTYNGKERRFIDANVRDVMEMPKIGKPGVLEVYQRSGERDGARLYKFQRETKEAA